MKHNIIADRLLYKYYKINNENLNAISEGKIWAAHPSSFNDPFDAKLRFFGNEDLEIINYVSEFLIDGDTELEPYLSPDTLLTHLGDWIDNDPTNVTPPNFSDTFYFALSHTRKSTSELIAFLRNKMPKAISLKEFLDTYENLGITSFATEAHDPKMWAHYADNHRGICVSYNLIAEDFNKNKFLNCTSVRYEDGPYGYHDAENAFSLEDILDQLSLKSKDWMNEAEVRIISLKNTNCLLKPMGLKIKGICFGLNTSLNDRKIVQKIMTKEYPKISFYDGKMNDHYSKINWINSSGDFESDFIYKPRSN